jgi:hypothetical protein
MNKHNEEHITTEDKKISCKMCLKEIPISEIKSEEANDYIANFCGLECYDKWKSQKQPDTNDI